MREVRNGDGSVATGAGVRRLLVRRSREDQPCPGCCYRIREGDISIRLAILASTNFLNSSENQLSLQIPNQRRLLVGTQYKIRSTNTQYEEVVTYLNETYR